MRFDTVLFDLDGTLIDSIGDLTAAGNHVCALHGWPAFTPEEFARIVGHGQLSLMRSVAARGLGISATDVSERLVTMLAEEFTAHYQAHKAERTAPFAGICDALDALRRAGVRLGVLTNKDAAPARELVAGMFGTRFDAVQGREPGMAPKPDPTGARMLMGRLGTTPARTLMVGDSEPDMQVATAGGMASCGVLWGYRSEGQLLGAGASHLVASPPELAGYVLGA